MSEDNR